VRWYDEYLYYRRFVEKYDMIFEFAEFVIQERLSDVSDDCGTFDALFWTKNKHEVQRTSA